MKFICHLLAMVLATMPLLGQTASLRGQVTDESGALVPGATVALNGDSGLVRTSVTTADGSYSFAGLPPGNYTVQASAPDLRGPEPVRIVVTSGLQVMNIQLRVAVAAQQVTVESQAGPAVSTEASNNASAIVLRGADLDALSDNPDDLQADLQALAGPSAGPNGGSIFVDGFSGGQLPPKSSIREIRINQNPFSPEYDTLGYGRIEVLTKPGTDKFHGSGGFNFGDTFWNSRDPFAQQKAPFRLKEYEGGMSGPISKRASFNLDLQRHEVDDGAIVSAITLDPQTLAVIDPFTAVSRIPQHRFIITPRVDYQLSRNHTLVVRYNITRAEIQDSGIGNFNLISRGYHRQNNSQMVQGTETSVLGASAINETRFQFIRNDSSAIANTFSPAMQVLGSFNGGGSTLGRSSTVQNSYELQNNTSILRGTHTWRFGVRVRRQTIADTSPQNFNGTFTFAGGLAPALDTNNQAVMDASGQPVLIDIQSIERYRRTLLFEQLGYSAAMVRQLGGGATQFSINSGNPSLSVNQTDVGAFVGDDWRVRPNFTLSLGLRYETQTNIHDWRDVAPRIGLAWAPGGTSAKSRPKSVIRAGFGMFYDRFALANTLTALRFNGTVQQQFVINNPDFFPTVPSVPSLAGFQATQRTVQEISSDLRAPYVMQAAVGFERQLPFNTTVAVTYANTHGLHLLRSEDINSPLPGTYDPLMPGSGVFPLGTSNPLFLMESSGLYNQNQLITNVNARVNRSISLTGSYVYNRASSNTDGLGTFPANPYNFGGEYGPAATDVHHRVSLSGSIDTKWNVRFSPNINISSGPPFNITAGQDLYGDTLFNGRPGIATNPNKSGLITTRYGLLDPNPTLDETILPRNFGRGPGTVMINLRVGKTFFFGPSREGSAASSGGSGGGPGRGGNAGIFNTGGGGGGGGSASTNHRYSLSISMATRNLVNHTNPGPITGNITSPLFGRANQTAGSGSFFSESANNRRLELQTRFTF
jgi:hypothetical protein